jgi:hypothetical protein
MKKLILKVWMILAISFLAMNVVGQESYSAGYPIVGDETHESATLKVSATVGGQSGRPLAPNYYTVYVVLNASDPIPSIQNVIDWSYDANGGTIPAGMYGDLGLTSPDTEFTIGLSGLLAETNYVLYLVTVESDFVTVVIEAGSPTAIPFTTEAEPVIIPAPAIVPGTMLPAPSATEVSRAPAIEVQFDKQIQWGVDGFFRLRRTFDDVVATTISAGQLGATISADLLSIVFTSPSLEYGTEYYVEITNDFVRSVDGSVPFPGLTKADNWSFTTESSPPIWATGQPSIQNQNSLTFDIVGQVDQNGAYYYVVTEDITSLDHATIYNATIAPDNGGFLIAGNNSMTANVPFSSTLNTSSFEVEKIYYLFVYAASGDKNSEIIRLEIDRFPPRLRILGTYPNAGNSVMPIDDAIVLNFSKKLYAVDNDNLVEITEGNVGNYIQLFEVGNEVPLGVSIAIGLDDRLYTITPTSDLSENTSYYVEIGTVSDAVGNTAAIPDHTFSTDKQQFWTGGGADPGDWADLANWSTGGFVSGKSVTIPATSTSFPTITTGGDVDVHNLTIEPGAALTHTGGVLSVTGLLHLQSSPEVNATYLNQGGTLVAEPNQIRVDQVVSFPDRTYHFASPVTGATRSSIGSTQVVYFFNNSTGSWENAFNNALDSGLGYITRSNQDLVFSGALNFSGFSRSVTRSPAGFGWNLIGNPYTATLDFSNMITPDIEPTFWLWRNDEGIYGTMNFDADLFVNLESDLIPSNHSFFIKVKIGVASTELTFDPSYLVNNEHSYLKSTKKSNIEHIKLAAVSGSVEDQIAIGFIDNASVGVDRFDSEKYLGRSSNVLELFSLAGNNRLAINCQPGTSSMTIPLGFSAVSPGSYKIKLSANTLDGARLFLKDAELNVTEELYMDNFYEFDVLAAGTNSSRFSLSIERVITDLNGPESKESGLNVYSNNSSILLVVDDILIGSTYAITDMAGRTLNRGVIEDGNGVKNLGQVPKGSYVVQINNKNSLMKTQKVVVY